MSDPRYNEYYNAGNEGYRGTGYGSYGGYDGYSGGDHRYSQQRYSRYGDGGHYTESIALEPTPQRLNQPLPEPPRGAGAGAGLDGQDMGRHGYTASYDDFHFGSDTPPPPPPLPKDTRYGGPGMVAPVPEDKQYYGGSTTAGVLGPADSHGGLYGGDGTNVGLIDRQGQPLEPTSSEEHDGRRHHRRRGRRHRGGNDPASEPTGPWYMRWRNRDADYWKHRPWFVWIVSLIQVAVFIAELAKMGALTGSPIQTKPSFNPMIGPSTYVMINMGARFDPCMHAISGITDDSSIQFPCPNSTTTDTDVCSLSELCGMGGIDPGTEPHQWWRFITPIFLHAGFIHIGVNLLLQLKMGAEIEQELGPILFPIVYLASGIAGFVLGANFAPNGVASTGASGALFGVIALDLLDLLFNWQLYESPKRNLAIHIVEIIVCFVIGLLPGLDNFSHIGGFAMGILVGTAVLRSPLKVRTLKTPEGRRPKLLRARFDFKNPKRHLANRQRMWYVWGAVRVAAVVLAIVYFVTLIKNFQDGGGHCSWCKYLSCLPVNGWCDQGVLTTTSQSS